MAKNSDIVCVNGVEHKASDLFRQYFPLLKVAAASTGLARDLCEDVALDTLNAFFQEPGRFDPAKGALGTFLCTGAKHRAIDFFRKLKGDRLFCMEDETLAFLDERGELHASLAEYTPEDACLLLTETLRRLSKGEQNKGMVKVFTMYVVAEMSRKEIAEKENVRQDYVSLAKTRLYDKFIAHLESIKREDEQGCLIFSDNDIMYLEEYIPKVEELS